MSISRWKLMACLLAFAVGGVAIMASHSNNKLNAQWDVSSPMSVAQSSPQATEPPPVIVPVATKPTAAPSAPEPLPPIPVIVPTDRAVDLEVPIITPASGAVPPPITRLKLGDAAPVLIEPVAASELPSAIEMLPAPREVGSGRPTAVEFELGEPMPPSREDVARPMPPAPVTPPMVTLDPLVVPMPTPPTAAPPVIQQGPPAFDLPPMEVRPPAIPPSSPPIPTDPPPSLKPMILTPPVPPATPPTVAPSRLRMLLRLGDGKPRFEIRDTASAELLFKVYGEKIEMQAPSDGKKSAIDGVTAVGKVRFTGPGVEGTCDQLCVLSGSGEVMLKGSVFMRTKRGKTWSEMTAEKMIYQIGFGSGSVPVSAPPVTPASYHQNR
jgi:hypothetical protein